MIPEPLFPQFLFEMAKQWIQVPPPPVRDSPGASGLLMAWLPQLVRAAPTSGGPELLIPYCGS